jgi:hypothetical protein
MSRDEYLGNAVLLGGAILGTGLILYPPSSSSPQAHDARRGAAET